MATYALIHGAGDVGWYWHLVERELRARGHETVAPDLPIEDDDATLADHARVVLDAIEALPEREEIVVVGQSWGGYIAPIVAERAGADRLILVAGMIPQPGETADEMWEATGWRMPRGEDSSAVGVFYHDVDPDWPPKRCRGSVANQSRRAESRGPFRPGRTSRPTSSCAETTDSSPPTGCARVVRERLHIAPDEIDSGHTPALSHPVELVELMESYRLPARIVR